MKPSYINIKKFNQNKIQNRKKKLEDINKKIQNNNFLDNFYKEKQFLSFKKFGNFKKVQF